MKCQSCTAVDDKVIDSRRSADGTEVRRRRQCRACGARYSTFERSIDTRVFVEQRKQARRIAAELKSMAGRLEGW